ncbi:MAG: carboxypeptidase-like regulatory domain-containing protein [Agriterribacter sp.]
MKNIFFAFILLTALINSTLLHAQDKQSAKGAIKGTVVTSNNQPAEYVTVSIAGIKKTLVTDEKGTFEFKGLSAGAYIVNISLVGHQPLHQNVIVEGGKPAAVNFQLQISDVQLNEIIIRSERYKVLTTSSASLRQQTPLLELPQNIQEIPAGIMNQQMQFNTAAGFTRNVSGARSLAHQEDAGESIYIRGFKSGVLRNGLDAQGTFAPLPADIFNIERVEFVKGPAGFMMSNGEAGGFYNVVTKSPVDANAASVRMVLGSFSTYRGEADFNHVFTKNKKLKFRLNAMAQSLGSYILYTGRKGAGIAPSLKFDLSDKTTVTFQYQYIFNSFYGGLGMYSFSQKGFKDLPVSFTFNDPAIAPTTVKDQNVYTTIQHKIDGNWTLTGQLVLYYL